MHTDASLRFERGVDPNGQARAIERATELLLQTSGGEAGPIVHQVSDEHLPAAKNIHLRRERVHRLLGVELDDKIIVDVLEKLGLEVTPVDDGWNVLPPGFRFDLETEVDLIEEIVRLHGYDEVPEATEIAQSPLQVVTETSVDLERVCDTLIARDYDEAITYSFIDENADSAFSGVPSTLVLSNPISSEMSVMRSSLLPGLVAAAASNISRQLSRVRLFEIGKSFHGTLDAPDEVVRISAVACGSAMPEQWGAQSQAIDFFDIKSDVEAVLELSGNAGDFVFEAASYPALQPGQAANILRGDDLIGYVGKLHPRIAKLLELKRDAFVFELDAAKALASEVPVAEHVSRFPAIRRDVAVIVDDKISADELVRSAASAAPNLITAVRIFDIYKGPGIEAGLKSVAMGLILQETSRTLTDDDADAAQAAAVQKLRDEFDAELRD
jgi:phenylalanyl-tRNA synthetase beta chain